MKTSYTRSIARELGATVGAMCVLIGLMPDLCAQTDEIQVYDAEIKLMVTHSF